MRIRLKFEGSRKRYEELYLPDMKVGPALWKRLLFWFGLAVGWVLLASPPHW